MNFLDTIVEHKTAEVSRRRRDTRVSSLSEMEYFSRTTIPMRDALLTAETFGVIAEIKRSSPSAGTFAAGIDPAKVAQEYLLNGASAISVLTDERFFCGSLADLHAVRSATKDGPLLMKEFIIDDYQVFEAKAYGADAVLLIATILERSRLADLFASAKELGLECLVELYEAKEIDRLDLDTMKLIGVNNRDLRTFTVDLNRTISLAQLLPPDVTLVSESGIQSVVHLQRLQRAGVRAALIGEYLMRFEFPGKALNELLKGLRNETDS
jgi:indole-3-glycerol phosphate synthase